MSIRAKNPLFVANKDIVVHAVTGFDGGLWVHTHGLSGLGYPELEIRGVKPSFVVNGAVDILNNVANYMVQDGKVIKPGENMRLGKVLLHFGQEPALDAAHYPCQYLTILDPGQECSCCRAEKN